MQFKDLLSFISHSVLSHRLRSSLTSLGIGIGVAAVVLLTSIGEGLHEYMLTQFTQFGTHIVAINPGKSTTFGTPTGVFNTQRPLTIDDAEALKRVPFVENTVPAVQGNASVKGNGRERRTTVTGVGPEWPAVVSFTTALGEFLPFDDPRAPRALAVLGSKLRDELYADKNPLGELIRIGGDRYRVIGVMESKGTILGFDLDDAVYIPAARSLELFNRESLLEIDVLYSSSASADEVVAGIERMLIARHGGEDFTVTTQQQMLDVLGSVLGVVTFAVGALGSISLLVGGVGIFTIMTIAVRERTTEIGLLRAVGAMRRQIRDVFMGESVLLAAFGGLGGLLLGGGLVQFLRIAFPALPLSLSLPYIIAAEAVAVFIGLAAGVLPARRAAAMDPVEALRTE
jgi:putative ABC transport system permease protein